MPKVFRTIKECRARTVRQPVIINVKNAKGKVISKKKIQYVEGFDTIDFTEQNKLQKGVKPTNLMFQKSLIKCNDEDIRLIEFLEKHPDNTENGGNLFKLLEVEKEILYELENMDISDDAILRLKQSDDVSLKGIAIWFLGVSYRKRSVSELRKLLRIRCLNDVDFAKRVIKYADEKNNEEKQLIAIALDRDIIKIVQGRKISWGDDEKEIIYIGSSAKNVISEFSLFCKNDQEGNEVIGIIIEKIENLKD